MTDWNTSTNPIFRGPHTGDVTGRPDSAGSPLFTAPKDAANRMIQNPVFFSLESTVSDVAGHQQRSGGMPEVPTASLMGAGVGPSTSGSPTLGATPPLPLTHATLTTDANVHANQSRIKSSLGVDHPEESRFEEILRRLLTHEISLSEGVRAFRDVAVLRGKQLRELATSSGDSSSPIYMKLMKDAEELHFEGKTWSLLYYLFAHTRDGCAEEGRDRSYPAGTGGKFVYGAGMYKTLRQHAVDMVFQDDVLNRAARVVAWLEEEQGRDDVDPAQGLGRKDGIWRETRLGLDGNHTDDTLVRQLDPDGMIREDGALHKDNAKDEDRLAEVLWRLMRSGRLQLAAQVCQYVGQPWRAASLTGYGKYGPLPVGEAAEEVDENETGSFQTNEETLAGEVERAEFGLEGENKVLWRWACYHAACAIAERVEGAGHGRYESATYGMLSGDVEHAMMGCTSWEDALWVVLRCWLEYQIDTELLGMDGMEEVEMDEDGGESTTFPIPAVAGQMPEDLPSAVRKGAAAFGGIESTDRAKRFRKVQVDLMLGELESLVEALKGWIVPGGSTEEAQDCPPGLMRFSAHLALLLWRMNLVRIVDDDGSLLRDSMNDGLQKLVWIYVIHLIDSASYELVPTYVVHLRKGLRRTTMQLLLEEATYNERIDVRKSVSLRCDRWLNKYIGVEGIESGEMWASTQMFCFKSMRSSFGGPLTRAESISWMFFDPKYRKEATETAVELCRNFALSGVRGALAGLHLLREVIPQSLGDEDSTDSRVIPAELDAWETYFEVIREVTGWQELFSYAVAQVQRRPEDRASEEALKELSPDTESLFKDMIKFIKEGVTWIETVRNGGENDAKNDGTLEAILIVGPAFAESDAVEAAHDASAYPEFSDSALAQACADIENICKVSMVASSSAALPYAVGPAVDVAPPGCDLPGLACIKLWAPSGTDKAAFEETAVSIFCSVLKNEPLCVTATNLMSSASVSSAVCKAIVVPTLVIHLARIREALAFIGECGRTDAMEEAEALIEAAKGQGVGPGSGPWSEDEMRALHELEEHGRRFLEA